MKTIYPYKDLNIGDSFTVTPINPINFRNSSYMAAIRLGVRFKVTINPDRSVTVKRIEPRTTPTITITRAPKP